MSIRLSPRLRDTRGFVVLGPLVLVAVVVVVAGLLGKVVRYPYPDSYVDRSPPRIRYAVTDTEVVRSRRVVQRLQPGDSVWVSPLGDSDVAVFVDSTGTEVAGFVWEHTLSPVDPGR